VWNDKAAEEKRGYDKYGNTQEPLQAHQQRRTARLFRSTAGAIGAESEVGWLLSESRPVRAVVEAAFELAHDVWIKVPKNKHSTVPPPGSKEERREGGGCFCW
jgi:hypothetical protein